MKRLSPFVFASLKLQFLFLALMSVYRMWFYREFSPYAVLPQSLQSDFWQALWLGLRLDLSVLGYVMIAAMLLLIGLQIARTRNGLIRRVLTFYFFVIYLMISLIIGSDMAFYSYFGEHINIMIFRVMDDDTSALMEIALRNYNLPLIGLLATIYMSVLWKLIGWIFRQCEEKETVSIPMVWMILLYFSVIALSFLAARGSLGHFPISKNIVDVSPDPFINKLPKNGIFAFNKAYSLYKESKSGEIDIIKMMGYSKNIQEAFTIHAQGKIVDPENLIASLEQTTPVNLALEKNPPHVVVIMVESFGMPMTAYQSKTFDIMGRLKKHFDHDTLFTNFISGSNGTIGSMEPFLLNIAARPASTSFGQSNYMGTAFNQAAAKVYQSKGYETSYVYGGDLSWRNVGGFFKYQGFDHVEGKASIVSALGLDGAKVSHSWGVFDQYAYDFLIQKLEHVKAPQFMYLMTTNNHPPYDIPGDYHSNSLQWSAEMTQHMSGDKTLLEKRLHDYAYAVDMVGRFMDEIKNNPKLANTVVVITADNNTIESSMKYDDPIATAKQIPFYLYLPKSIKPRDINTSVAGSHKDIFPTLYNVTLSDARYISMGVNLLEKGKLQCGFNDDGILSLIHI